MPPPKPKIAIIGANGRVGAELCLLLSTYTQFDLVPICRNRSGSAFLRWQGIACRHGRSADPTDAARLLGDCDVVVNSSLAAGSPAQIRSIEDRIIDNAFTCSKPSATIIHFSTQSVYGDPRRGRLIRWRNPYGRVKLATERRVRANTRRHGKTAYILRLGHVCGAMQGMSLDIRREIRAQRVILPDRDHSSNTVYTAAIVAAIAQVVRGGVPGGTYDLMNHPPWTWREVYDHEARMCGAGFTPVLVPAESRSPAFSVTAPLLGLVRKFAVAEPVRIAAAKLFAYVPDALNARALAWWYRRRAASEISAVTVKHAAAEHLSWLDNGSHPFPAEQLTTALLAGGPAEAPTPDPAKSWPADLPDAAAVERDF